MLHVLHWHLASQHKSQLPVQTQCGDSQAMQLAGARQAEQATFDQFTIEYENAGLSARTRQELSWVD
jgi:S-ribosylhomocysteine lyase LuxS involved in autoinducer biosynthesis